MDASSALGLALQEERFVCTFFVLTCLRTVDSVVMFCVCIEIESERFCLGILL